MKRLLALLLALCLCLTLFACAEHKVENTLPTDPPGLTEEPTAAQTAPTTMPTEPPTEPDPMAEYVETARVEIITLSHGDGTNAELTYRYPEVLLAGDDAEFWNRQIAQKMDEIIVQAQTDAKNGSAPYETMDYSAWISGDILVVFMWMQHFGVEYTAYQVGLFDLGTTEALSSGDLFCRITGQRTPASMTDVLSLHLASWYDKEFMSLGVEGDLAQREKTLAPENLEKAWLYLDEAGALMAVVPAYTVAGTEMTTAFLELTDFSPTQVSIAPDEDATLEELVTVYRSDELPFSDTDGDHVVTLALPQVNLDTPGGRDCNWELRNELERFYDDALDAYNEGWDSSTREIGYDAWIWENTLTVLIWEYTIYEFDRYFAYVFDLETGERMTNDQVAALWNVASEDWRRILLGEARRTFMEKYENAPQDEFYFEQMERCMDEENVNTAMLYPTAEGVPMALCRIHAIAGASYYWHQLRLPF